MVAVDTESDEQFFVKTGSGGLPMLQGEFVGVQEIRRTNTIRVLQPIAAGEKPGSNQAFAVYEFLRFTRGDSQNDLGQHVARMHRFKSKAGFGFDMNKTIGATHQSNRWTSSWAEFLVEHRLRPMLKLTDDAGLSESDTESLVAKTRALISHNPPSSLLHGDLWDGNKWFRRESDGRVKPCVFDPATYYGDREANVAMTYLFGWIHR
jgi:fructosamine-3-kinase